MTPPPASPADVVAPADVPTGNTYDKYASKNPIERRLMTGFFAALDALVPSTPPASVSVRAKYRAGWLIDGPRRTWSAWICPTRS